MGAIDYNFMSDYLMTKDKAAENKNKIPVNIFGSLQSTPFSTFALGGDLQSHGSDWSTGLTEINAGGSHEESPYDGVQMGVDPTGKPNKVEEGETVFNDYVYSTRIQADAQTKKLFHLPKKSKITYADISKKIIKEAEERPNDPISQNAINSKMELLAEQQERQKQEKAQAEFEALSPEQQQAIIQQVAQQQQLAQQEAMQQQGEQPMPDGEQQDIQSAQDMQPQMNEQQEEPLPFAEQVQQPTVEEPQVDQMNAYGGNLFKGGGTLKQKILGLTKSYTDGDFSKWAAKNNVDISKINWDDLTSLKGVTDVLSKDDPILRHALSMNYNFDTFRPEEQPLVIDFLRGGWGKEGYHDWDGSKDAVWQEAVKKGLVNEGMTPEEIGKALQTTDAYKKGTEWLQASPENRLKYLQAILNSPDAPPDAKAYAAKYVDNNGWLKDVKQDYKSIFTDPDGVGVRNTHPGTYWKTPENILREDEIKNYVKNEDGTIEEITGVMPTDWKLDRTLSWQDEKTNHKNNYYLRPSTTPIDPTKENPTDAEVTPNNKVTPKLKDERMRTWAPLMETIGDVAMREFGVGDPRKMWGLYDKAVNTASQAPVLADYKPIGNYLNLNPMDVWAEQNRMNANTRATDRAIMNSNASMGTKMAGLLANEYNNQANSGDLFRKALEYNDANKIKEADFNRGTDMFNSQAYNQASQFNASAINNSRNAASFLQMQAALNKTNDYASWNKGYYNDLHSFFNTLGQIGKENAQHNMIAKMAADDLFGNASDKQNIFKDYINVTSITKPKTGKARGGRIHRKK